jgi:hypothetical protein
MHEKSINEMKCRISNIICYEDKNDNCLIKAESNGEIIIKSDNKTKFENLFLPRKLKSGVLVVDLPLQVS